MNFWPTIPAHLRFRLIFFLMCVVSLGGLLSLRLAHVQLVEGAEFEIQADDNRFYTLSVPAERGVFLDRYGQPLVWNTQRYYQVINPDELHHQQVPISREDALTAMASESASVVTTLERLYKYPESLSQVLGFVGAVTADELAAGKALSLAEKVGKLGLELSQNQVVRGVDGKEIYEINAVGERQKLVSRESPTPGNNLTTTLDPYLSEVAYRSLNNKKGVVLILDAATGEVLSLVSSPSYNANVLTQAAENSTAQAERQTQIQAMFTDDRQLFFNRAVDGIYPPGSIFKIVTALAGLEEAKLDKDTEVVDEGILKVGDYDYGNWYFRQYGRTEGPLSLVKAISRSNDIYFYKAAEWVGPEALAEYARLFGLGQPTGVQLSPQARGLVPDPAWKEQTKGERWYLGNTYHYGIGQGDLLVSPIQMAQMIQAVANQGTLCPPTLIESNSTKCMELGIRPEHLQLVLEGMLNACSAGGTGFPFFPRNTAHRQEGNTLEQDLANGAIACKTGTAEFGAADANDHRRTHGWFVGITEFNQDQLINATPASASGVVDRDQWVAGIKAKGFPRRLVFLAMVESDEELPYKEGSTHAAPVVKTIIDWMAGE